MIRRYHECFVFYILFGYMVFIMFTPIDRINNMEKINVWFRNALHFHERIMMRFLQKRNWVVFYLEPQYRVCGDTCWLKLYESGIK